MSELFKFDEDKVLQSVDNINQSTAALIEAFIIATKQVMQAIEDFAIAIRKTEIWRERFPDETIIEYLDRNPDMIDNPDVRWEYQCYIWQTPIRLIRQWIKYKRMK